MNAPTGETVLSAVFRARIAIIAIAIVVAIAACAAFPHTWTTRSAVLFGASLVIACAVSFIQLRHWGLAALVALAPLPGLLIASAAGFSPSLVLATLPGISCAIFLADEIARRIATGIEPGIAALDAMRGSWLTAIVAIAIAAIPIAAFLLFVQPPEIVSTLPAMIVAGISAVLIMPLAASFLPFSENFITRANRVRERRERWLERLAVIAEPRWGMSLAGVAIVFSVMGIFGAQNLHATMPFLLLYITAAGAAALTVGAFAVTLDWRRALSVLLTLAVIALVALWEMARTHNALDSKSLLGLVQILGIVAVPVLFVAAEASRALNEDAASAARYALLHKGVPVAFVFLAAGPMLIVQFENVALIALQMIALFFGLLGALLFQPAFASALETLIPGKSGIEARYRLTK